MPFWKSRPLERLLDGPVGAPLHVRRLEDALRTAKQKGFSIAAWGKDANAVRSKVQQEGVKLISIEDGFLRSAGLGAALTPSLSFSFDAKGIYYDPSTESDLEDLLQSYDVDGGLIKRAEWLKGELLAHNLSKYNLASKAGLPPLPEAKRKILVIGQVADDEAVLKSVSDPSANINRVILSRVRAEAPDAFIIYKPHPDVERLGRAGLIAEAELGRLCEAVFRDVPITEALDAADEVAVFTSLAGFEALIRGKTVRVFGRPFYAGWGLTKDAENFPRRSRKRSLEELLAITLIVYPRYYDPVSKLPCPVEVAVYRLTEMKGRQPSLADGLRQAVGRGILLYRRLGKSRG
jgi:capsular polysaccharide export protein